MSDPPRRETRPNTPSGGEPGARPRGRDSGPPPGVSQVPAVGPPGPRRDPGRGEPDPQGSDPWRRDPGRDGRARGSDDRDPGRRGAGGTRRDHGSPARRGGDQGADAQTIRMPVQPGAAGPRRIPDNRTRLVMTPAGGRRDGAARGGSGPRETRGRRDSPRPRGPVRWGTWQGGLGVCIVIASAAIGAIGTMASRSAPGILLELLVVAGAVTAALAVRPRAARMILPVPALAYLVAALLCGVVYERPAGLSRTALALAAVKWIANGFYAMALATVLAVAITAVRWYLWHRGHRDRAAARDRDWAALAVGPARAGYRRVQTGPAQTRPAQTGRRSRPGWEAAADPGHPAGYAGPARSRPGGAADATDAWGEPGSRRTGPGRRSWPYNFSSGA
jgi:Domain of unknown function (DUF6542)